jgi:hypothetical protein
LKLIQLSCIVFMYKIFNISALFQATKHFKVSKLWICLNETSKTTVENSALESGFTTVLYVYRYLATICKSNVSFLKRSQY